MVALGYRDLRKLPNKQWIGVAPYLFTYGLCIGMQHVGFTGVYHYATLREALEDCSKWNGEGDPPGRWIKYKDTDGERMNPIPC